MIRKVSRNHFPSLAASSTGVGLNVLSINLTVKVLRGVLMLAVLFVFLLVAARSAHCQVDVILHNFAGSGAGSRPYSGLIFDRAGNLYGETNFGGLGYGTIYKLSPNGSGGWVETVLYSFTGLSGDGEYPNEGLTLDAEGNLYGTTWGGGTENFGTIFKLDPANHETVLYGFTGGSDGANPDAPLTLDAQGNLYGTTTGGDVQNGSVFKLDVSGNLTTLHSFTGTGGDGRDPYAGVVLDSQGNLYGTTQWGGAFGNGIVFKLSPTGTETVLHAFQGIPDGANPNDLILDAEGNLYSTTFCGGLRACSQDEGCGVVFKLDAAGNETVLYSFKGGSDGEYPEAGVTRDAEGNLYGTTSEGGRYKEGTAFEVSANGTKSVLYNFKGGSDAELPAFDLVLDAVGNLYGATYYGGTYGVAFEITGWPTITTLQSSPNPSMYGQSVTFTAAVRPTPPDGETVKFEKGTTVLGTETLTGGTATFTTATLGAGTVSVKAAYSGDTHFAASTSKSLKQVVDKYATATTLSSSVNPSSYEQAVTFTATVTSAGPTPTGK